MKLNPKITINDGENEYSFPLMSKKFSTGSVGYSSNGKITIKNESGELKSHTFNINLVEIGSKKIEKTKVDN